MKMDSGIIFAIVAAIAFGAWTIFHKQASDNINSLFGAIIISLTAVIIGALILIPQLHSTTFVTNYKGIVFAVLAGLCALAIDYFALKAYGSGLAISVAGPVIIGGSIAVASTIGFFLGESITYAKIIGLLLVIIGSGVLSRYS